MKNDDNETKPTTEPTPELECGAASLHIELTKGRLIVKHGTGGEVLLEGTAERGCWAEIFGTLQRLTKKL